MRQTARVLLLCIFILVLSGCGAQSTPTSIPTSTSPPPTLAPPTETPLPDPTPTKTPVPSGTFRGCIFYIGELVDDGYISAWKVESEIFDKSTTSGCVTLILRPGNYQVVAVARIPDVCEATAGTEPCRAESSFEMVQDGEVEMNFDVIPPK